MLAALALWIILAVTLIGVLYAVALDVFFFFAHLALITHVRGNAVRLGRSQLPELHRRVETIAREIGIRKLPRRTGYRQVEH